MYNEKKLNQAIADQEIFADDSYEHTGIYHSGIAEGLRMVKNSDFWCLCVRDVISVMPLEAYVAIRIGNTDNVRRVAEALEENDWTTDAPIISMWIDAADDLGLGPLLIMKIK